MVLITACDAAVAAVVVMAAIVAMVTSEGDILMGNYRVTATSLRRGRQKVEALPLLSDGLNCNI